MFFNFFNAVAHLSLTRDNKTTDELKAAIIETNAF